MMPWARIFIANAIATTTAATLALVEGIVYDILALADTSSNVRGAYAVASHDNTLVEGGAWPYTTMAIERSAGIWLKSDDDGFEPLLLMPPPAATLA